jgi:hypothetical protein
MSRYEVSEAYELIRSQSVQGSAADGEDTLINNKALPHYGDHIFGHNPVGLSTWMCPYIVDGPLWIITLVLDARSLTL